MVATDLDTVMPPRRSRLRRAVRAAFGGPLATVGTIGCCLVLLVALLGPVLAPYDPVAQRIVFTGLRSGDDYLRLSAALQRMSVVRAIRPLRASGDRLEVELDLLTGMAGFRRMVDGGLLLEVESGDEFATPVYQLR